MSVVLSEHLPLLATAPDGIRKLRGLILELAVRGMLVSQNPADEPASELLKRIAQERAWLETEGKKTKPLLPKNEHALPFEVPKNWGMVCLGGVLDMINGRAFKPGDWRQTGVPIVRIQNLNNPNAPHNYCDAGTLDERHRLSSGDFLISWSGTPGTSFGAFIWDRGEAALNQHIFRCVQVGSAFDKEFLRLAINSQLNVLIAKAQGGVGLQHVTKGTLEALVLPLPPKLEQHRIVAKVDELMALCDRLEAEQADAEEAHTKLVDSLLGTLTQSTDAADFAVNLQRLAEHFNTLFTTECSLDALKQTILQLAVMGKLVPQDPNDEPASELTKRIAQERARLEAEGVCKKSKPLSSVGLDKRPFAVPDGWTWTTVESIANVGTGTTPSRTNPAYFNPPTIPWVTSGETRYPFIAQTAEKVSALALEETNLTVYPAGTLIVAMYGQGKTRGQISELQIEATTNQACAAIAPIFPAMELRKYIKLFFEKIYDEIRDEAAGGAQPNLNVGKIKSTLISLPPLAEQRRIVTKVDELMVLCDRLKADLAESRHRQDRLASTLIESALKAA